MGFYKLSTHAAIKAIESGWSYCLYKNKNQTTEKIIFQISSTTHGYSIITIPHGHCMDTIWSGRHIIP